MAAIPKSAEVYLNKKPINDAYVATFLEQCKNTLKIDVDYEKNKTYKCLEAFPVFEEYPFVDVIRIEPTDKAFMYNTRYFNLRWYNPTTEQWEPLQFTFYNVVGVGYGALPTTDPKFDPEKQQVECRVGGHVDRLHEFPAAAVSYYLNEFLIKYIGLLKDRGTSFVDLLSDSKRKFTVRSTNVGGKEEKELVYTVGDKSFVIPSFSMMFTDGSILKMNKLPGDIVEYIKKNQFTVTSTDNAVVIKNMHKDKSGKLVENQDGKFFADFKFRIAPSKLVKVVKKVSDKEGNDDKADKKYNPIFDTKFWEGFEQTLPDGRSYVKAVIINKGDTLNEGYINRDDIHKYITRGTFYNILLIRFDSIAASKAMNVNAFVKATTLSKRAANKLNTEELGFADDDDDVPTTASAFSSVVASASAEDTDYMVDDNA